MKAYGLRNLIKNSMGVRTDVYEADYSDSFSLGVHGSLEPDQLDNLKTLVEEAGWRFAYEASDQPGCLLVIKPSDAEGG